MKIFVCDTSSLIHTDHSLQSLGEGIIVIPIAAYEELDDINHRRQDQASYNARQIIKLIDRMQEEQQNDEIILENGALVRLENDFDDCLPKSYNMSKPDNRILNTVVHLSRTEEDREVIFVSNDAALRTKARKFKVKTIPLAEDRVNLRQSEMYNGWTEYFVPGEKVDSFYRDKYLKTRKKFYPNQFCIIKSETDPKHSALARYDHKEGVLVPLRYLNARPWDISSRNAQQSFLIEALLDPNIKIVSVAGLAGSGKSLISLACGGHQVDAGLYRKMSVFKPLHVIGPDVGFLPGDLNEKLAPHMESIYDSLEFIFGNPKLTKKDGEIIKIPKWQYLVEKDLLELKAMTHLRGRSLPGLFMIIDEAQNISPAELKTILTRCGEGTKIIFAGDPEQIDNRYLDAQTNGLTYLTERFKGQDCFASVTLVKSERSALAELGSQLL